MSASSNIERDNLPADCKQFKRVYYDTGTWEMPEGDIEHEVDDCDIQYGDLRKN